jgi:hypothetical protein
MHWQSQSSKAFHHLLPFEPDSVGGGGLEPHATRQALYQGPAPRERDHRVLVAAAKIKIKIKIMLNVRTFAALAISNNSFHTHAIPVNQHSDPGSHERSDDVDGRDLQVEQLVLENAAAEAGR